MDREELQDFFNLTAKNFKFQVDDDFRYFFDVIYHQIKDIPADIIRKKFQQLWLKTTQEWQDEYGYSGYPSLASWLEILTKKPLTDEEKQKKIRDYEEGMRRQALIIISWLQDKNIEYGYPFRNKYLDPNNKHLADLIDSFLGREYRLPEDRIKEAGTYLRNSYKQSPEEFFSKMKGVCKDINPLLLN